MVDYKMIINSVRTHMKFCKAKEQKPYQTSWDNLEGSHLTDRHFCLTTNNSSWKRTLLTYLKSMAGCLNRASCSLTGYSLRMVVILSLCCLRPILGDIRVTASRNGNTEWTNLTAVLKSNSSWVTKRKSLCTFKPKSLLRLSRWNCFLYIKIILSLLRIPLKFWRAVI